MKMMTNNMNNDLIAKLKNSIKTDEQKMALDNCVGIFVTGSHLYGTSTPASDYDYEGVFIEPPEYILGNKVCDEVSFSTGDPNKRNTSEDIDCKLYSLRKYFSLAQQNNPNKVEWFFIPESQFIFKDEKYWKKIVEGARRLRAIAMAQKCGFAKKWRYYS